MIIRAAILSIPQYDDQAISAVRDLLQATSSELHVVRTESAGNQRYWLEEVLRRWCDEEELDLILTIGGTMPAAGSAAAEITPEATGAVIERQLPGFSEAMRQFASQETLLAYLDRGIAGIRGRTLIVNLPAGAAPAHLFLEAVAELLEPTVQHVANRSAPNLAELLRFDESATDLAIEQPLDTSPQHPPGGAPPAHSAKKALNPAEFAEFLRRNSHSPSK
ncbi:MAG: molybdopterin-binding protein [Caldilineaceae bacterium]